MALMRISIFSDKKGGDRLRPFAEKIEGCKELKLRHQPDEASIFYWVNAPWDAGLEVEHRDSVFDPEYDDPEHNERYFAPEVKALRKELQNMIDNKSLGLFYYICSGELPEDWEEFENFDPRPFPRPLIISEIAKTDSTEDVDELLRAAYLML